MDDQSSEPVQVFVRIRPEGISLSSNNADNHGQPSPSKSSNMKQQDMKHADMKCVIQIDDKTLRLVAPDGPPGSSRRSVAAVDDKIYTFDKVFREESSQEEIYESISPLVNATVRGYNTTIFAYGCTGSS